MANAGINKTLVKQARNALLARGQRPTIDNVRIELGNTGSKSTIQRYLKELSDQPSADPSPSLLEELQQLLAPVAERLQDIAQEAVASQREALAEEQREYRSQRQIQAERIQQLQEHANQLKQQLQEQRQREHELLNQLKQGTVEIRRLQQSAASTQESLDERSAQLLSLEEKHRHARESLEHYRQHQEDLRMQELRRHEAQVQELQKELRAVQGQLLSKQNDVITLNRQNERLIAQVQALTQSEFEKERELRELHAHLKQSQTIWNTDQSHLQAALDKAQKDTALLKERLRPRLVELRQQQRQLRDQNRQIEYLHTLIQRAFLEPTEPAMPATDT